MIIEANFRVEFQNLARLGVDYASKICVRFPELLRGGGNLIPKAFEQNIEILQPIRRICFFDFSFVFFYSMKCRNVLLWWCIIYTWIQSRKINPKNEFGKKSSELVVAFSKLYKMLLELNC